MKIVVVASVAPVVSPPMTPPRPSARASSALTHMLEVTVREGTCAKAFRDERGERYFGAMRIAAKTGTLDRSSPGRLFSWFAGFAPSDRPQVAVAVMLANDRRWWRKGNQVGRDILRAWFARHGHFGVSRPLASGR